MSLSRAFADPEVMLTFDNDIRLQVAEAVVRMRHLRNLTQAQLAVEAGLTQARVSQVESGSWNITAITLERLLSALDARLVFGIIPSHWPRPNITKPEARKL